MNFVLKYRNLPSTRMCHPCRQRGHARDNLYHEHRRRGLVGLETDAPVSRSSFGSLIPAWLNVSEVFSRNAGSRMGGSPLTIPVHPPSRGRFISQEKSNRSGTTPQICLPPIFPCVFGVTGQIFLLAVSGTQLSVF